MGDATTGESLEAALAQSENSLVKELIQNPFRVEILAGQDFQATPHSFHPSHWDGRSLVALTFV